MSHLSRYECEHLLPSHKAGHYPERSRWNGHREEHPMWKKFELETIPTQVGNLSIQKVRISGYLDSSTFPQLQEHLDNLLKQDHHYYLLDLENLDYISSAGLGVLMGILREVREKEGDLKIINMSEKISRVFDLLGFSRLMKVYPSEQEALDAFLNPAPTGPEVAPEDRF
ncbi:MAG: Anti-sigma-B factor antagonist [Candidatus Hinthialibacteria bacterium OLB16]|nr:MAG: Anti-sigma-B factor antagonist [Candidatus Hinthialibacteria bacterium OLB16]